MIAKAVIEEQIGNKFKVRIPLFESAGNKNKCILTATLSYVPGNLDSYVVGDVVFVAFENNQISSPVIIGKLYLGEEKSNTNLSQSSVLKVINEANLPNQTAIGEFSPSQVYSTLKNSEIHENRIIDLEQKMKSLLDDLTPHPEPPTYELYSHNINMLTISIEAETYPSYNIRLAEITNTSDTEIESTESLMSIISERGPLAASGWWKTNASTTYQIHSIAIRRISQVNRLVALSDEDTYFQLGLFPIMNDRVTKIL